MTDPPPLERVQLLVEAVQVACVDCAAPRAILLMGSAGRETPWRTT